MSLNKLGEKSLVAKKADAHLESWQEEIEKSIGRGSRKLGIYNRKEVESRLRQLAAELSERPEFEFISALSKKEPEIGVYLVGGSVRDAILARPAKDIDLVINRMAPADLAEILSQFGRVVFDRNPKADLAKMNRAEKEQLISNAYGVIKFKPDNSNLKEFIDIAFPREDNYSRSGQTGVLGIKRDVETRADPNLNIVRDLERRDLTINALAVNLVNKEIIDPFDGIEDLVKRKIRAVGDPKERILKEDFSRGFRALRFACIFNSDIELETKRAIREIFRPAEQNAAELYKNKGEILEKILAYEKEVRDKFLLPDGPLPKCLQVFWDREQDKPRLAVPAEVMSKEIFKAIKANPRRLVELLAETGGLKIIFPELERLKNLAQPREHHREGDVWRHTLLVLDKLPSKASLRLKLAALFHDLGKADTQAKNKEGKITFYGHNKKSAEHIKRIAARLRWPKKLSEEVAWLAENHMLPLTVNAQSIKATKLEKIFLDNKELGRDLIALAQADALSSLPEKGEPNLENINFLISRIKGIEDRLAIESKVNIPSLIAGKDLISLGLEPGPIFKEVLDKIREVQLDGRITNKREAVELAEKAIKRYF